MTHQRSYWAVRDPVLAGARADRLTALVDVSTGTPTLPDLRGSLRSVNVGRVGVLRSGGREIATAYAKGPLPGRVPLGRLGHPGDEHVYEHHGGPDMAVCVYPLEHYRYWADELGLSLPPTAAFGENWTVQGLVETDVWLGDVFSVGDAVVQVTQPRSPCYKIAARYGLKTLAVLVQRTGYTGYLLRVLQEGRVGAGDELRLVGRSPRGISVAEANRVCNVDKNDLAGARRVLDVPDLPADLTDPLVRRLREKGSPEDRERLFGEE